jgi:non-ribosomal peptide synthetase component F
LVDELSPKRTAGQNPIFQAWFFLDNDNPDSNQDPALSDQDPALSEVVMSPVKNDFSAARLDLALTMKAYSDRIVGVFTYATDLFEPETISTLVKRFRMLLRAVVNNPDWKLLDIPLTNVDEDQQSIETTAASPSDEMQDIFIF